MTFFTSGGLCSPGLPSFEVQTPYVDPNLAYYPVSVHPTRSSFDFLTLVQLKIISEDQVPAQKGAMNGPELGRDFQF